MALLHAPASAWNRKTVFFIHGIGFQPVEYSEPLYKILRKQDPATADATRWHEVTYDEANAQLKAKVVELQKRIPAEGAKPSAKDLAADFLVDLVDYLATQSLYDWINNYVRKALVDAIQEGTQEGVMPGDQQLYILSHSLGTVVSYEVLHSIVSDAQVPGLSSGVRIKSYMTFGSPLAFIKAHQAQIPSFNKDFFLRKQPIGRPFVTNPFTDAKESNVTDWFNFRHKLDPVGSLTPLDMAASDNSLSRESFIFDAFNTGLNSHDFANYITQYRKEIMEMLRA